MSRIEGYISQPAGTERPETKVHWQQACRIALL
jgi:hypothetical protein